VQEQYHERVSESRTGSTLWINSRTASTLVVTVGSDQEGHEKVRQPRPSEEIGDDGGGSRRSIDRRRPNQPRLKIT
jgi:hypothetical protein